MILKNATDIKTITKPQDIYDIMKPIYKLNDKLDKEREQLYLIGLDTRNNIKTIELVSMGTINETLLSPREIFRTALIKNCVSIILVHNHPSQDPTPSQADIEATAKIKEAGKLLEINLLDHVIYTDKEYASLKTVGVC
jgi:DNA repair protein RadC